MPGMDLIIPIRRNDPFDDPAWLFDLKLDGFRGLADTINARMLSKNGNPLRRFDDVPVARAAVGTRLIVRSKRIPLRMRLSSTRGIPRGLSASIGLMTPHSQSVSSYCMIRGPILGP